MFHNKLTEDMPCLKCAKEKDCKILERFIDGIERVSQRDVFSHWEGLTFKCDSYKQVEPGLGELQTTADSLFDKAKDESNANYLRNYIELLNLIRNDLIKKDLPTALVDEYIERLEKKLR